MHPPSPSLPPPVADAAPRRKMPIAWVWLAAILGTAAVFATTSRHEYYDGFDTDGLIYAAACDHWKGVDLAPFDPLRSSFAANGGGKWKAETMHRMAPWNRRVLTPWLAAQLPLSTYDAFAVIAYLASAASLPVAFLLFRRSGFDDELAFFGMLLYGGCFWTVRFAAFSPAYIDHGVQFFLLLSLLLTQSGRYGWLLVVLFLGTLQKESLAALAPFAAIHLACNRDGRSWPAVAGGSALLCAAPAAALLATRALIPADNPYSPSVFFQHLLRMQEFVFWPPFLQSLFSGLGMTIPLLALRHPPWIAFLRGRPEWIYYLLVSLAFLFGGGDKTRLWLYFLPLGLLLVLSVVREFRDETSPMRFRLWLAVFLLFHIVVSAQLPPLETFWGYLIIMVPEYAGAAFLPILSFDLALALFFILATAGILFDGGRYLSGVGLAPRATSTLPSSASGGSTSI